MDEYDACDSEAMSVAFQNHLYGCFSIIEQHTENGSVLLDLSNTDLSKDLSQTDQQTDPWTTLGIEYGFLEDSRAIYTGSDRYRSVMTELLLTLWTDEQVEALELSVFEALKQRDAKYFVAALEDATEGLMEEMKAAFINPKLQEAVIDLPPKPKKNHSKTAHKKRDLLSKPLSKTRKNTRSSI
uniref:Uncharacterized protein n=1 Tax=viral metagenome TaxID=1070528 RepID=A0A6C0AP81_9ZZZZ